MYSLNQSDKEQRHATRLTFDIVAFYKMFDTCSEALISWGMSNVHNISPHGLCMSYAVRDYRSASEVCQRDDNGVRFGIELSFLLSKTVVRCDLVSVWRKKLSGTAEQIGCVFHSQSGNELMRYAGRERRQQEEFRGASLSRQAIIDAVQKKHQHAGEYLYT